MKKPESFAEEIWIMDGDPVRMYTIPFTTRMTIIRLSSGGLWVHSPVTPTNERCIEIDKLGRVEHIIAPNRIHSLGIKAWAKRYPNAHVWVSPKFCKSHKDIHADFILHDEILPEWQNEIEHFHFAGSYYFDEVFFFHKLSKTIIITDIIQKHDPSNNSWFWKKIKSFTGVLGLDGGTSIDLRSTFTNKTTARESKTKILSWNFNHLIISHGKCIKENAKDVVTRDLSWI